MNHKERVLRAINFEEPDRVPIGEFGFHITPYIQLCRYFGIDNPEELYWSGCWRFLKENLRKKALAFREKLGTDLFGVWVNIELFEGSPKPLSDGRLIDVWKVIYKPSPNVTAPQPVEHPLKTPDDLDAYEFPDFSHAAFDFLDKFLKLYKDDYAIYSGFGWTLFERSWYLRGFEQLIIDMYRNPGFVEKLMDKIVDYDVELAKMVVERDIDIFFVGDDFGSQHGLLIPPSLWRKFIKPRMKKILQPARKKGLPILLHSDGDVTSIIDDLIELGVTILNPVQPLIVNPAELREKYGENLSFYGTIDVQKTLPFGSVEDVKKEAMDHIKACGYNGGLIVAPSHTILPGIPIENILAISETAKKYGRYPVIIK